MCVCTGGIPAEVDQARMAAAAAIKIQSLFRGHAVRVASTMTPRQKPGVLCIMSCTNLETSCQFVATFNNALSTYASVGLRTLLINYTIIRVSRIGR